MEYRILGKTGLKVSEVGFGGIPILRLSTDEAVRVLRHAYDRGVNFYDTANAYKDSEEKIGKAFRGMRDKVILATKTQKRDAAGAAEHLDNSLRMLQTDYIDIYQLHQVSQEKDWQAITAPGGALETIVRAKEQGKVRHIGVTSHNLAMAVKLVKTGLFETVQFPFNFIETAAAEELFPVARQLNLGIIAMKPFAGGVIDNARIAFKFLRQYPDVVPIPGFETVAGVDEILGFYETPNQVDSDDLALMERYRAELGRQFCRRCEYCQPCPHGVMITMAMGYRVVAHRMSPAVAVGNLEKVMATVPQCVECGVCMTRCPYNLPIPEILKKHYAMYEQHRAELGK